MRFCGKLKLRGCIAPLGVFTEHSDHWDWAYGPVVGEAGFGYYVANFLFAPA
jgi:hypothetical protein